MKILRQQNVTLFDLVPDELWALLCTQGVQRDYNDQQLIEEKGDAKNGVSLVISGEVAAGNIDKDGSFLVSALLRKGECYGQLTLFLGLPQTHSLWAVGATRIVFIEGTNLMRFLRKHPELYEALLKLELWRNVEMIDFMDAQRKLPFPMRIARLLLIAPPSEPVGHTIECRQEDLADTLGVSRVAIGKGLQKLMKDGLIKTGYGKVTILDRSRLSRRVNEEQAQS